MAFELQARDTLLPDPLVFFSLHCHLLCIEASFLLLFYILCLMLFFSTLAVACLRLLLMFLFCCYIFALLPISTPKSSVRLLIAYDITRKRRK